MPDLDINCAECGSSFPLTEREQDYYRERGLTHPKRCKPGATHAHAKICGGPGKDEEAVVRAPGTIRDVCDQAGRVTVFGSSPRRVRPLCAATCFAENRAQTRSIKCNRK